MRGYWNEALQELRSERAVYCAIVAAAKKGSPGTAAARMLVREDGSQCGTIGGGIMEKAVLENAQSLLASGSTLSPELKTLDHKRDEPEKSSGLICGGQQSNLHFILRGADDLALLQCLARAEAEELSATLNVSSAGLRYVENLVDFRTEFIGGDEWLYRFNFVNQRRIAIFGGGHCGVELARTMWALGYAVTVVEPRSDLFTLGGLPSAVQLIQVPYAEASGEIRFPEKTLVAVMTYSMPTDVEALGGILKHTFPSIGVMGSSSKIIRIRKSLSEMGFDDLQLQRICAPIGLSFNSDTPQEIAVSIAAQILLNRETKDEHG